MQRNSWRFLAGILCAMFLVSLTGCSKAANSGAGQSQSTLDKVVSAKKLRVGFLADYAPWGSRSAQGKYEGYDVDLATTLAKALGVELELIPVEAPNRVPSLVSGKVDVIIGSITPTDERAKTVSFTMAYASSATLPMVWADSPYRSYKDLAGKKVAAARGTTNDMNGSKYIPGAEVVRFDSIADAVAALQTKKVDALLEDSPFIWYQAKVDPRFRAAGEPFGPASLLAFAVKRGDNDWLNYLNNFLSNIRFSGENAALYKKWFGVDPVPLTLH